MWGQKLELLHWALSPIYQWECIRGGANNWKGPRVNGHVRKELKAIVREVLLLRPDECQSDKHSLDLGNLPGDSSNEDRLQVRKEVIRTQKYLGESCYHCIKCTTAAFLTALMWRRPLNSVFNHYCLQKSRKVAQYDRYLSTRLDERQVDDGNGLEEII